MKRQTRIITLLIIDSCFFFVEIIVGNKSITWLYAKWHRLHGPLISSGSRFISHGNQFSFVDV